MCDEKERREQHYTRIWSADDPAVVVVVDTGVPANGERDIGVGANGVGASGGDSRVSRGGRDSERLRAPGWSFCVSV